MGLRAGASWEERQTLVSLCFLFRGLLAANRGAEILAGLDKWRGCIEQGGRDSGGFVYDSFCFDWHDVAVRL